MKSKCKYRKSELWIAKISAAFNDMKRNKIDLSRQLKKKNFDSEKAKSYASSQLGLSVEMWLENCQQKSSSANFQEQTPISFRRRNTNYQISTPRIYILKEKQ